MEEISSEEFEKLPEMGESWLSDYNLRLVKEIKNEGFRLKLCSENYDYHPKETRKLEKEIPKARKKGFFTKDEVLKVVAWKAPRQKGNFVRENNADDVEKKTGEFLSLLARAEKQTSKKDFRRLLKEAIHSIAGCPYSWCRHPNKLNAVGIPIASAILRFIDPERYGVIDKNALNSLGKKFKFYGTIMPKPQYTPQNYIDYLDFITQFGKEFNLSPVETDIALYMYGRKHKKCFGCDNYKSRFYCARKSLAQ